MDISLLAVCWESLIWSSIVGLGEWLSAVGLQQSSRLFCCYSIPSSAHLPLRESPEKTGADLVHLCFSWCCGRLTNPRVCCPLPVWSFNWDYILEQGQNVELAYSTFRKCFTSFVNRKELKKRHGRLSIHIKKRLLHPFKASLRLFRHIPSQAFIIVGVFLMSVELEIIQSCSINMDWQSCMACHSVQTDKLLCCQSGHQLKQIARVTNDKQEDEKIRPVFITMGWIYQMADAFFFFCTQLLYNHPHLHAMLLNRPN